MATMRLIISFFCFLFLTCSCRADLAQETIYLTWQQSPSTTMTIQWLSLAHEKQSIVSYRPAKREGEWLKTTGEVFPFPQLSKYLVHRVELKKLQPDTEYVFTVLSYPEKYLFLTAPARLDKELRFVVGGDMYHDGISFLKKTCQKAAQFNPLFALVGGDIAYAVVSRRFEIKKTERWLDWIKVWHACMVTSAGHLIPTVAAIGNHDLIGQFDQTPAQAAIFSTLFPMPGKQIYNVLDFDSYLSILILDSGHANPIKGRQADWLKSMLEERRHIPHRFALYHVPAYPSCRHFDNKYCAAIRQFWVPIFEQEGLSAAFEHHDHAYKRTYPLLNGKVHPQGIVYIGDGGWGVEKPRRLKRKRFYLAKFASTRHFIGVTLTPSEQQFKCINDEGQVLDDYRQPAKKPKVRP